MGLVSFNAKLVRVKWSVLSNWRKRDSVFQCQIGTGKVVDRLSNNSKHILFQCQIGTGKVLREENSSLKLKKFQCQIGTGKVNHHLNHSHYL